MLKELSKLSGGLLLMHGYVTDLDTARRLARSCAAQVGEHVHAASRKRRLPGLAESVMLAPIWVATPMIVLLAAAELVRMV
jgi:hypothetical protein